MYKRPLTPTVGDLLARFKKPLVCVLLLLRRCLFMCLRCPPKYTRKIPPNTLQAWKNAFPPFALHIGLCPTMLFISIPGCQALWTLCFWELFLTQEAICVGEFWATYIFVPIFSCSNICSSFLVAWTQIAYHVEMSMSPLHPKRQLWSLDVYNYELEVVCNMVMSSTFMIFKITFYLPCPLCGVCHQVCL
jgi:hypothetical protein